MKDCERISGLFVEFYDDQMDRETRLNFDRHLNECPSCREEFRWYGLTVTALSNLETAIPPRDFLIQLNARLDPSPSSLFSYLRNMFSAVPYLPLPAGVGVLAVLAVLGLTLYKQGPTEIMPTNPYQVAAPGTEAGAQAPKGAPTTVHPQQMQVSSLPPLAALPRPSSSSSPFSFHSVASPKSIEGAQSIMASRSLGTVADAIGADNLTVESPSVDQALESLKKMLPNVHGRLVEQRLRGADGDVLVGVLIPPQAYGPLATELINHGAVEVGAGAEVSPPTSLKKENNNVLLYIRFVQAP